jgi:hypothetical protein
MIIQMLTDQAENKGLGPALGGAGDSLTFSHGGANDGFRCMLFGYANRGKGVVIMTNSDNGSAVTWEIMRSISDVYKWDIFKPVIRKVIDLGSDSLLRFEGTYQMNPEYVLQITLKDQKLYVHQNWDGVDYYLYPESELVFFTVENNTNFVFETMPDKEISGFTVMGQFVFTKSPSFP